MSTLLLKNKYMYNIAQITYNGYRITVTDDQDTTYNDLTADGYISLHCSTRYLSLGDSELIPDKYFLSNVLEDLKHSRIFIGDYGAHSGIWLTSYREIKPKEIKEFIASKKAKYPHLTKQEILDMYTLADLTSDCKSITITAPKDASDTEVKEHWKLTNSYIKGEFYIINIEKIITCNCCPNVVHEHIDSIMHSGDYQDGITEAQRYIDGL